jgi:hypothetical protein
MCSVGMFNDVGRSENPLIQINPLITRTRSFVGRTRPNILYPHVMCLDGGFDIFNLQDFFSNYTI